MKRIGLLVLVGVWAVLGFAQESVVDHHLWFNHQHSNC